MTQRPAWTIPAAILLPACVLAGYAIVTSIGLFWPEHPGVAIGISITVSILLWIASTWWAYAHAGWWRVAAAVVFALALAFPMVGAASLGTDLALEKDADVVSGEVVDIHAEKIEHRRASDSYRTTYTFVAVDDGRDLGTVEYRGGKDGHGLEVGDRAELMVDPSGELPVKLAETVDSSDDVGGLVMGAVLYFFVFGIALVWGLVRRPRS